MMMVKLMGGGRLRPGDEHKPAEGGLCVGAARNNGEI